MMTCTAATNSAPRSRKSRASDPMTTISERALLMGWRWIKRFRAPPTHIAANMKNRSWCSMAQFIPKELESKVATLFKRDHQTGDQEIGNGDGQQHLPSEGHQLVIAKARQRAADPYIKKNKEECFEQKPENRQETLHPGRPEEGAVPSAEKKNGRQKRHGHHVRVLGHEEHGELQSAVLSVIAGHELGFRFRKIKRDAVGFGEGGGQINEKGNDLPAEDVPPWQPAPIHARLRIYDFPQTEAARENQDADQRESQCDFVAHHLRACPQRAQQGVLAV